MRLMPRSHTLTVWSAPPDITLRRSSSQHTSTHRQQAVSTRLAHGQQVVSRWSAGGQQVVSSESARCLSTGVSTGLPTCSLVDAYVLHRNQRY